jgi:hypothetical protein
VDKENNFDKFTEFIGLFDKSLNTNNFKRVHKLFPLIERFEENFLNGYHKRKKEGAFYTKKKISEFIVSETLICLINKKLKENNENIKNIKILDDLIEFNKKIKPKIVDILLNITICDPACGSGNFLLSAAEIIYNIIINLNYHSSNTLLKKQILSNLYGFDINEYAIKLCILKMLRWSNKEENTRMENIISILKRNLKIQNSILNSKFPKCDIIIGNPPYGNILNQKEKSVLKKEDVYSKDIYCAFLLKALNWSNEIIGFLVPKSFLLRQSYITFRNKFLSKANIIKIFDIGSNIFKKATNEVQIIIYENRSNSIRSDLTIYNYPKIRTITYLNQLVDSLRICFNFNCPLCLKSKKLYAYTIKKRCPYCNSNTIELNRIRIKPNEKIYHLLEKIEKIGDLNYLNPINFPKMIRGEEEIGLKMVKSKLRKDTRGSCFFISARNDFSYYIFKKNKSLNLREIDPKILKGNDYEYYKNPKLLIKHNNIFPEAIYSEESVCFTSSIYSLLYDDISELKYLCAVFNSILIQFYCIYAINNQKDTTINLNQYMIRHLPIIKADDLIKDKIVKKVDLIKSLLRNSNGTDLDKYYQILREIDTIVFDIYSITEKEANLIILYTKNQIRHFETIYNT